MKKILLSVFIVTFMISTLYAGNVEVVKAQRIGEKFMKESTSFRNRSVSSELVYTYSDADGTPYIYIFNVSGVGFVAVSAEDRVKPILAYST
ncbi:MAG: Spi family protease inhibitor, partial [Bacteroidales bacterium]|nr:Spi family protease inhibitor [Bacteroidales bacterium]